MIALLVEASYVANRASPTAEQVRCWLAELRFPGLLIAVARAHPAEAAAAIASHPLVSAALTRDEAALQQLPLKEQTSEQAVNREYWKPLKPELERQRRERRQK